MIYFFSYSIVILYDWSFRAGSGIRVLWNDKRRSRQRISKESQEEEKSMISSSCWGFANVGVIGDSEQFLVPRVESSYWSFIWKPIPIYDTKRWVEAFLSFLTILFFFIGSPILPPPTQSIITFNWECLQKDMFLNWVSRLMTFYLVSSETNSRKTEIGISILEFYWMVFNFCDCFFM